MTNDWLIVASVQGGEILARDGGDEVVVSFPEGVSEATLRDVLMEKDIEVGDDVVFEAGESEGEMIAYFRKA